MPLALLTRPLHACVLVLAALLAVTAYAGPAQDFAAADNGGRAHLLEHWAATPTPIAWPFSKRCATTALRWTAASSHSSSAPTSVSRPPKATPCRTASRSRCA